MRRSKNKQPHLFVIIGVAMILAGAYLMIFLTFNGRNSAESASHLPLGITTLAMGAMLLTRTPIAVFFLLLYAIVMLTMNSIYHGILAPMNILCIALLALSIPLARNATK